MLSTTSKQRSSISIKLPALSDFTVISTKTKIIHLDSIPVSAETLYTYRINAKIDK